MSNFYAKYDEEINLLINQKALEYAEDEKKKEIVLVGMINVYAKTYNKFIKENSDNLGIFLKKIQSKKEKLTFDEINVVKLLYFLSSWETLLNDKKNKVNIEEFDSYVKLSTEEIKEWDKSIIYAQKKMKFKNIEDLNDRLQFIIAFNDNARIRKDYFKNILLELRTEEEQKEKDYRDNIYEILFQNFKPKVNQYIYMS